MRRKPSHCPNGHLRIPANRTTADKCKVCASVRRTRAADAIRQSKRLQRDRERTEVNLSLRQGHSVSDDNAAESVRSATILHLMDRLETVTMVWERAEVQAMIDSLRNIKTRGLLRR